MGGDTGGNDCVHVQDVRVDVARTALERHYAHGLLRHDTDVIIRDEHGNVCQFTYAEWHAFRLKMADGTFDHIGALDAAHQAGLDMRPGATGMDPSAKARLDALPDVSGEMIFPGEPLRWAQNTHIGSATGTPEHLRAVAEELERRDAAMRALGVATVKAPECELCAGTGYSGDSATPNGGCRDCRGTGLYNGGEL